MHPRLVPLQARAFDRALVSVAAGVVRHTQRAKKKTFMCVVVCESSSGHITKPGGEEERVPDVGSAAERKANGRRRREAEEGRHSTAGTLEKLRPQRLFAQDDNVKSAGHSWGAPAS